MFDGNVVFGKLWLMIIVGLAAAFWANFITEADAAPRYIKSLRSRKPFSCELCMSFWCSFWLWWLFYLVNYIENKDIVSIAWFVAEISGSAFVSMLWLALRRKLDILII